MKICITGSLGLVGLAATKYFLNRGNVVVGIDNNMRQVFFGNTARTDINRPFFAKNPKYYHKSIDIRDYKGIKDIFKKNNFDVVIHAAGQPSHDKARKKTRLDFEVNTVGTFNLLEATRNYAKGAVFIFTSTNKAYGDNPNRVELIEEKKRYFFADPNFIGFDEGLSIDYCLHSFLGASKLAADIYVQEYGRCFGLKTTSLRLGCITGPLHASVKLHGFLSFLIKSLIKNNGYEIIGYKGKQVRDQLHVDDLVLAMSEIIKKPVKGEIFNLGGGKKNSASILELIEIVSRKLKIKPKISYKKKPRLGDHICYITDYSKFKKFYPKWRITRSLDSIIDELISYEQQKLHANS